MRRVIVTAVCACLALGTVPAAAVAEPAAPPGDVPQSDAEVIEQAEEAWSRGDWAWVRSLLEPVAEDPDRLTDSRLREKGLCLLADAVVNDPELDEQERTDQAGAYLERLLDADPDWRLPPAISRPDLFELFAKVQDRRNQQTSMQCDADLNACAADLASTEADLAQLQKRYDDLKQRYDDQDVEIRQQVARSRVFAAIPFGIGHFYNGERALGGVFLGTELTLGAAGLILLAYRSIADGCRRESGFQRGSLVCSNRDLDGILRRRQAEEGLGWAFVGSIALDIFLAQYRFKPFKTQTVKRVPRRELDGDDQAASEAAAPERRRKDRKPRAKVRPTGGGGRYGFGLGVSVRF